MTVAIAAVIPNAVRDLDVLAESSVWSFRAQREIYAGRELLHVYLLTRSNNKVMYVDVTNNLTRRVYEHQNKLVKGFTEKYNINKLVYYEQTNDVVSALTREKEIKKWRREKKNALVVQTNPKWNALSTAF